MSGFSYELAIPTIRVSSLELSLPFYQCLGFSIAWVHQIAEGQPQLAAVHNGPVQLFLTEHSVASFGAVVYINTRGVDALEATAVAHGLRPTFGPADRPWGLREVYFHDPDGNVFRFGERSRNDEVPVP
jgi:catechol 2,3-dioxygenase-like lactoylglutathione lyase family enzyme